MALRLCDDDGYVSDERAAPQPASTLNLTYLDMHNNMRAHTRPMLPPITEQFACTGSAHLGGEHIYCTSPAHAKDDEPSVGQEVWPVKLMPEARRLTGWLGYTATSSTAAQPCKPGCIHQEPHAVEECLTHAEFMALGVDTDE